MSNQQELKPGWRRVKFGDVVQLSKERSQNPIADGFERFVGLEHIDPEDLCVRRWGNVADGTTFTSVFRPGQVLFGKRRAYQRKVAVADFAGVCSGDIYVLESKDPKVLLPELLPFICQTEAFFEHAVGTSAGSLSPRTNWASLAEFNFELPPIEQQKSIVSYLQAIDQQVTAFSHAQSAAAKVITALMEDFLSRRGPNDYRSTASLLADGPRNGLSPSVNGEGVGYPTLSLSAVRDGKIVAEGNTKYADIPEESARLFALAKADVLVVRGNGNKHLTGRCGIVESVPEGCFYPDLLIRLRFDETLIRPQFAALQWNAPSVHNRLIRRAKSTNGIWKINGADIKQHQLAVPSLSDQDKLMTRFNEIQSSALEIALRTSQAQELKRLVLNRHWEE